MIFKKKLFKRIYLKIFKKIANGLLDGILTAVQYLNKLSTCGSFDKCQHETLV